MAKKKVLLEAETINGIDDKEQIDEIKVNLFFILYSGYNYNDEYKEINIQALYKSHAMSGTYDDRCEGYVIVEKSTKKEGIVSKTYLKCGSIYTTEGYGTKSTKIENKTIAQSDNDTEPPKIKLNGEETITIGLDEKYVDKGAIAVDNVDSEVKVKTSGKVDTSKEGTYTVSYYAGNAVVIRRVTVK